MKRLLAGIVLGLAASFGSGAVASPYVGSSQLLPPIDGAYVSQVQTEYNAPGPMLIDLTNFTLNNFSNLAISSGGGNTSETFDSIAAGYLSVNGGSSSLVTMTGSVGLELFGYHPFQLGTFNAQITALNLTGNTAPLGPIMIRLDPTVASTGQATFTDLGGGKFQISSFFDIFTELTLDDGQTWIPATNPTPVDLTNSVPEPSTWAMMLLGFAGLGFIACRRKSKSVLYQTNV